MGGSESHTLRQRLTLSRFKNYEAAWENGQLNVDDKNYGALPAAGYSSSSVSHIKAGDSLANRISNDDDGSDDEKDEALDLEAGKHCADPQSSPF